MSNKAIIVAVLLALGLLSLILYSNWRSTGGGSASPVVPGAAAREGAAMPIHGADVVGIKVAFKGEEESVVRDAGGTGGWSYVVSKASAAASETLTWPADPAPIEHLLRALSDLKPASNAGRGGSMPADAALVTLTMKDASTRLIRISTTPVAGSTLVDIDGKTPFMHDASILVAATQPGPRGWRVSRALPGASAAELSRISVTTPAETLAFSRQENRWFISRPVSARAGASGVGALLDSLSRIEIDRFVAAPPSGASTGLLAPRMIISTERDIRSVDAQGQLQTEVRRRSLFIGGPADPAGNTLFASSDPSGVPLFTVNAAAVAAISTSARTYLDVTASSASPSDIGLITIKAGSNEIGYRRVNGKWHKLLAGGKLDKAEVDPKRVAEMVDFFTARPAQADLAHDGSEPASAPAGSKPDHKVTPISRVSLMSDDGTEIDTLTMGYTPEGVLAARSRDVVLTYTGAAPPKLLALPEFKPGPGQAAKKKAKPPTAESRK